jgi:1-acyl-sn-glycerol-3-phosphate acyltransferase
MQNIFIEKPYRFVTPWMPKWLPWLMNTGLIHAPMLRFTESIISVESHGVELLKNSIQQGHAVMMIGNHPRMSDPVVVYDLIRKANTTMFGMASWHLFNQSWFHSTVLKLYGAYSVNREGLDRESINFSIRALQNNDRPVLMFPEGATTRTNESLMPFLDGPTFIARTVARRRSKNGLKTVIHPIAFRYQFVGDFEKEFNRLIVPVEQKLNLGSSSNATPVERVQIALCALVEQKEIEFNIASNSGLGPFERRQKLAHSVLELAELRCFRSVSGKDITNRIRDIRAHAFPELLENQSLTQEDRDIRWLDLKRSYLAWQMASYPEDYLSNAPSNDRILDISAKVLEDLTDTPRKCGKQKVMIECCEAIEVPTQKHLGEKPDPLQGQIESALKRKLN